MKARKSKMAKKSMSKGMFDKFVDQYGVSGSRPVRLAAIAYEDLVPQFRSVSEKNLAENKHLMANITMPLYNGLEIANGQHGRTDATMLINFGTMCDMPDVLQEALLQENGVIPEGASLSEQTAAPKCAYPGNTGKSKRGSVDFGTPVALDIDPRATQGTVMITPIIDMQALAQANYKERVAKRGADKDRFKDAPAISESTKDRLKLNVKYTTAKDGIGAMTRERARENVARAGSQVYLMTARKNDAARDMFSPEQINGIADKISKGYEKFLKDYAKGSEGLHPALRDAEGNVVPGKVDKSQTIDKTDFPSFEQMGLGLVTVKGATVLAAVDLGDPKKNAEAAALRHAKLPNVSNAFNAIMSREFNSVPTMTNKQIEALPAGSAERDAAQAALNTKNLGCNMKLNLYMTTPQSVDVPFSVVQPSMNVEFTPYASMVRDTIECAQHKHDGPDGPAPADGSERLKSTIDQVYGTDVLNNARTILANAGIETDPKALLPKDKTTPEYAAYTSAANQATQDFANEIRTAASEQLGVELLDERQFNG